MDSSSKGSYPNKYELNRLAERLIKEQNTLTLATTREDIPWAAAVYYVNQKFTLFFFSDPASRHIRESLSSGQTSAAISVPASTWQEIRGVQASGVVSAVPHGLESLQVLRIYLKKYPFTKEFFDSNQDLNMATIMKRFNVRLYRFRPNLLYYLDNGIHFGFRERVELL